MAVAVNYSTELNKTAKKKKNRYDYRSLTKF